jgi:hypothetical protein
MDPYLLERFRATVNGMRWAGRVNLTNQDAIAEAVDEWCTAAEREYHHGVPWPFLYDPEAPGMTRDRHPK